MPAPTLPARAPRPLPWPEPVQRVARALAVLDPALQPQWLQTETATVQALAEQLGVAQGQIARSLVLRRLADQAPVLVVIAGDRRIDEACLARLVGGVAQADACYVETRTGFAGGSVAPVGHREPVMALLDASLQRFGRLWTVAGHPRALVRLTPAQLETLTGAPWAELSLLAP